MTPASFGAASSALAGARSTKATNERSISFITIILGCVVYIFRSQAAQVQRHGGGSARFRGTMRLEPSIAATTLPCELKLIPLILALLGFGFFARPAHLLLHL